MISPSSRRRITAVHESPCVPRRIANGPDATASPKARKPHAGGGDPFLSSSPPNRSRSIDQIRSENLIQVDSRARTWLEASGDRIRGETAAVAAAVAALTAEAASTGAAASPAAAGAAEEEGGEEDSAPRRRSEPASSSKAASCRTGSPRPRLRPPGEDRIKIRMRRKPEAPGEVGLPVLKACREIRDRMPSDTGIHLATFRMVCIQYQRSEIQMERIKWIFLSLSFCVVQRTAKLLLM